MSVHILKSIRAKIGEILDAANIAVDVAYISTPVLNLERPPSGTSIDEADTPAFFVFIDGEDISPGNYQSYNRATRPTIFMFARSVGNPSDQLDAMQLQIELALEANKTLGGICFEFVPVRMTAQLEQGRVEFAARSLEYRCVTSVTSNNPTI